jgi:selenide,water dikinase
VLRYLPPGTDPNLLIGLGAPDDAAVYRLSDEVALVASIDFFTPLVDNAGDFGAIAAANALSDLYAMRATPLFALSVLAIPAGTLPDDVVGGILRGAAEVCSEAGIAIAGGHSIDDKEPKFGLTVFGSAHPDRLWRKSGARVGDRLVLGKAIGTGVITTGLKNDVAPADSVEDAVRSMRQLNRSAMEILERFDVHAATDVSGFGLLGHLREMCHASDVGARLLASAPELLPGAFELAAAGVYPGGTTRNRESVEPETKWMGDVDPPLRVLLCDAQTSGGLLAAVPAGAGERVVAELSAAGYAASEIGEVIEPAGARIEVDL